MSAQFSRKQSLVCAQYSLHLQLLGATERKALRLRQKFYKPSPRPALEQASLAARHKGRNETRPLKTRFSFSLSRTAASIIASPAAGLTAYLACVHGKRYPKSDSASLSCGHHRDACLSGSAAKGRAHFATASSQKRRKVSPFSESINTPGQALYHSHSLNNIHGSSPPSSPQQTSLSTTSPDSQPPSPTSSNYTRNTTPPRFIPPHLHDEVLPPRESVEGSSPSDAFEQITIDSGGGVDMSDGNGNSHVEDRPVVSPGRVLGARSASPAKRSAAVMEGGDKSSANGQHVPGSFAKEQDDGQSHFDEVMKELSPRDDAMDTQDTLSNDMDMSATVSRTTNTSSTSFESDAPPPYSVNDAQKAAPQSNGTPSIDEQVKTVWDLCQPSPDEGERGYIVSCKWLARVRARSSEGLNDPKYSKDAREGEIGQVDNSDIVPQGAFLEPVLKDMENQAFIPINPGLTLHEDFEILPYKAWGLIIGWYGLSQGQKQIVRYAHNTAPPDAALPNVMYEFHPPVITVRKVLQPGQDGERPPTPTQSSLNELRLKDERLGRGQLSRDDAVQLVSSRSERFNDFLKRTKFAVDIPREHKVKIWKLLDPSMVTTDKPGDRENGILSPPESRSASPKAAQAPESKLAIDSATFAKMELGIHLEHIDAKDETSNAAYNGKATMELYQLFANTTIALEEMLTGPAGGEFASDSKKLSAKFSLNRKNVGSKPGSATASGRTSPAPGTGMMTRGRQRRDGRTRGTVGLTNLGNTCYMNSALQCIRSVEELAIYFLSGKYKTDINVNNPLGHHGNMANRYADILRNIYTDGATGAITPSAFKKTIGQIQPMFSGYGQQDSQEFLSFLVDALHEDLNRIQKKPYNENPDSDDKTVHDPKAIIELGETYRSNHRARNDSVAMDLFSGFYKNTMECPICDKISITFDPYSLLTVQLPIESTFQHTVTFVPLRGRPVNHNIDMDKNATIKMLKENIASKHKGVTADRLWMAEVYSHKIYKIFENATTLSEAGVQANDYLFVYELEGVPSNPLSPSEKKYNSFSIGYSREDKVPEMDDAKADQFAVPIFSRQKSRSGYGWDIILHPLYIVLTREEAQDFEIILKKVLYAVSRVTNRKILTEFDEDSKHELGAGDEMKVDSTAEDDAQISDGSMPSEEGYVEISVENSEQNSNTAGKADGGVALTNEEDDRPAPKRFMDPQYFIPAALRNQLFALNYAQSDGGGMHCTGMSSIKDASVRNMFDRVKQPARRQSVQSSSSGEESTTSTTSGPQANGEDSDESDVDDLDKPDMVLGGEPESYLSIPPLVAEESDEDEVLPDNPLDGAMSRAGRRKQNKRGKKGRNKLKTYGKKGKHGNQQNRPNSAGSLHSTQSHRSLGGKPLGQNDNPYYIKLGEGIVLDWYPQALDALFGGDADSQDDEDRGLFISSADGRGLPTINDPAVTEKRSRREARKKHGITLDDCFVETGKREVLSEDNAWYCNRCKELRRATKTLEIWTIPDILVVHLKRFGGTRSFRDKIDVLVDYPIEGLDMTDKIGLKEDGKEYIYDLFAVDNHFGGLGGGHYTAMAKNFYDQQWYDYNDSSCTKTGESRLHSAAAYLLFYRRRSEKPLGPQYLQDLVLEARNPPSESAAEETAEDSDSGEGRLGGPNGSLLGSSSALKGAGVDPANLHGGDGGVGAGPQVSNSPTTRTSRDEISIGVLQGEPVYGPQRPAHLLRYAAQGASWNFDSLNDASETDDPTETLMINVDNAEDDDAASTTAVGNFDLDDRMEEPFEGFEDNNPSAWSTAGRNTPVDSDGGYIDFHDDHQMYSTVHESHDSELDALHLEDAGMIGESSLNDPPVQDIYPDPLFPTGHDKMD